MTPSSREQISCLGSLSTEADADVVLAYHELTAAPAAYRYSLPMRDFEKHLSGLVEHGRPGNNSSEGKFRLTFDDGHVSCHELALAQLDRYRLRATFFVTTGW